jgi:hypothetical protein
MAAELCVSRSLRKRVTENELLVRTLFTLECVSVQGTSGDS